MRSYAWLNGEVLAEDQARLSVWDGGFLHGAGLFETMRAEHGRVFRLGAHLQRLVASAAKLLSPITLEHLPSGNDFQKLLAANGLEQARLRLTVSAGPMTAAEGRADEAGPALTVCATAAPLADYPAEWYRNGVSVLISRYRQSRYDPLAGHKCTSYLPRLLALRGAHQGRCAEALWFTTDNWLAEGSISNVFIVEDGRLRTPPLDTPVLPGIARSVVIEQARASGIDVSERSLSINDLLDADEVFLTNSIMRVMPVCRVEQRDIGTGKPGPLASKLLEAYRGIVEAECTG